MSHTLDENKIIAKEVRKILAENRCSIGDVDVIYSLISGCPDFVDGGILWKGEVYSMEDLPDDEARREFMKKVALGWLVPYRDTYQYSEAPYWAK